MKKILIIQTASIGDVILATALLESLHLKYPEASLDFLIKKGNENLFIGHPFIHKVITWDKRSGKYANLIKIIFQARKTRYDLVINIQRFFLTGILTVFSGSRETRGFSKNPLSWFFSRSIPHRIVSCMHEVTRNQALISDRDIPESTGPRLHPAVSDEEVANRYRNGKYYTISPASLWFTKQYPVGKWVELIRQIPRDTTVYLLGAPPDQSLCNDIITLAGHPRAISLAGQLTLLQSAALMKTARMNFTNDSAPMHLASAVNAPVTAVYCSTIPGFGFGPLSGNSCVVQTDEKLGCRPCGLHGFHACPEKHFRCGFGIETMKLVDRL